MNSFLLPTQDAEHIDGYKVAAIEIIRKRIEKRKWPLYERTRNRKQMARGDNLLFYVAGKKEKSGHVIGECRIENLKRDLRSAVFLDGDDILNDAASSMIELSNFKLFPNPVYLKGILKELDCCPKNITKWGVILYGGARKISYHDFSYILSKSR